jgi:hypothetical protein
VTKPVDRGVVILHHENVIEHAHPLASGSTTGSR